MAYDNFQNEPNLPVNGSSKRRSRDHLPKIFRTPQNSKFLNATLDRFISPGLINRVNGFVGRKDSKAYNIDDTYFDDVSKTRNDYKFEPASIIKDNLGNTRFYKDFNDYTNAFANYNSANKDYSLLTQQEFYAWNPNINWDKFANFREYYWLPSGPQAISIAGNSVEVDSTIKVRLGDNLDSYSYIFTPDGLTNNPTLTLYRGITYKFDVDIPNFPIVFRSKLTDQPDFDLDSSSIIIYEGLDIQGLEKGTATLQLSQYAPDTLWYVSTEDININGRIEIKDLEEAAFVDVEAEILQKKYYKSGNGVEFSNGMKIKFIGEVEPAYYKDKTFYVEGVGDSITLIEENSLNIPSEYTPDIEVDFDSIQFDSKPFDTAIGYPSQKDYLTINRSSIDGNLWSRHNRWFHKDIIQQSADLNNSVVELDQNFRASRPIIEFNPNIKLYNYGTKAKQNIDLVDDFTVDVFSVIEGSIGYNVDGVDLADGMRVLFLADLDPFVTNKIYTVKFITYDGTIEDDAIVSGRRQITLVEADDAESLENETVAVLRGNEYKGKVLSFANNTWTVSQRKIQRNQAPLFDMFDSNNYSYGDINYYESSTFNGNRIVGYKVGTGVSDSELGFPLSYQNINNVGDIVFESDYGQSTFTYIENENEKIVEVNKGYLRKYQNRTDFENVSQWQKITEYKQPVIRQYVYDESFNNVYIDVYDDSSNNIENIQINVFKNNELLIKGTDYTVEPDVTEYARIDFIAALEYGDNIVIKTTSDLQKNQNGKYEFPYSLERNPKNQNLDTFTLGEVNDHVSSIVENTAEFIGQYPGSSNLRDISDIDKNGRRFLQHSAPLNLSLYHIVNENANFVDAIRYAKNEYSKFKREFLSLSENLGISGDAKTHVDKILEEFSRNKNTNDNFYFSDMVPYSGNIKTDHEIEDSDEIYFPLAENFTLADASTRAVQVYLNDVQLLHGIDYTFNNEGYAVVTANKQPQDVISIYEYESTNGNYIPPTPTKLGLYPLFEPKIYLDTTLQTPVNVIQGHDGSITKAYDDYRDDLLVELEKRIFNNIKVTYNTELFDISRVKSSFYRNDSLSTELVNKALTPEFIAWTNLINTDYHSHDFFERDNSFTYNYSDSTDIEYNKLPGFWREIFKYYYDTDRPNITPWEMLGFSIEPTWWKDTYGSAPYTKDNFLLWEDIQKGIIRVPNQRPIYNPKYSRPNLFEILPVDEHGDLIKPLEIGLIGAYNFNNIEKPFVFGDGAPVEAAWRRSSEYPFALLMAYGLNKPNEFFATAFDRYNQIRDISGNIIYKPSNNRLQLEDIVYPPNNIDDDYVATSGIINYIANYSKMIKKNFDLYKNDLQNITNQMGFKFAGYTEKNKLKLILDSRTPLNKGNVFVPEEDYEIVYNESTPVDICSYSGVIIERTEEGFLLKGYNKAKGYFSIFPHIASSTDYPINVGGISESYVEWQSGNLYTTGTIVRNNNTFYRCTATNRETEFNLDFFAKLDSLPIIGGKTVEIRTQFQAKIKEIPYGTLLTTEQEVVDFLISYGEYLQQKGFVFEYYKGNENVVYNWLHTSKEFLFWTLFDLDEGSLISLSPGSNYLEFQNPYAVVGDIYNGPNGNTLYNANGNILEINLSSVGRSDSNYTLYVNDEDTGEGIYHVELPLIQKEHVILLNNQTIFSDVIFDLIPGYRQERIKILGYSTDEWNGSANIPGFVFQDADYEQWESNKSYDVGDLIQYEQKFYVADKKILGTEFFNASNWIALNEKPKQGLLPNFEYKVNQFGDFYDLDSDNFDTEQQKFAQHLIGYQKRDYLENIIADDVSQYKFYQGMILEKGTQNAFSKLFDALASEDKDSLEFYEEWAIRDGVYGASATFDEFEVKLDEAKFIVNPQLIQIADENTNGDTTYNIPTYDVYVPSENINNPFPTKKQFTSYVNTAGYVHKEDVKAGLSNLADIIGVGTNVLGNNEYLWIFGDKTEDWNVYKHVKTDLQVKAIDDYEIINVSTETLTLEEIVNIIDREQSDFLYQQYLDTQAKIQQANRLSDQAIAESLFGDLGAFTESKALTFYVAEIQFKQPVGDIQVNDIIGINNFYAPNTDQGGNLADSSVTLNESVYNSSVNYFGQVTRKENDTLYVKFTKQLPSGSNLTANITKLEKVRFTDVSEANQTLQKSFDDNMRIWIDNFAESNNWQVLKNSNQFDLLEKVNGPSDTETTFSGTFGDSIAVNDNNNILVIGDPENEQGKVWVYSRKSASSSWTLNDVLEPDTSIGNNLKFGSSVDIKGPHIIVGSPTASNVKTKYKDAFSTSVSYSEGDIVKYKDRLWESKFDLIPALDGNLFNTFSSVTQGIIDSNQENRTETYSILNVGNYALRTGTSIPAFTGDVNHILVRVPKTLYDNTRNADSYQAKFAWNTLTKTYQDQETLVPTNPFNLEYNGIDEAFFESQHIIREAIDTTLYFASINTIPQVGDAVQSSTGAGTVAYVHKNDEDKYIVYLKDTVGTFNTTASLFLLNTGEFVGDFVKQLDADRIVYGGFWFIETPTYTVTNGSTLTDEGRGLIYLDISEDSTYINDYHNIYDTNTTIIDSENNVNSYIKTFSYEGFPNADNVNGEILNTKFAVRAPSAFLDTLSIGDDVYIYVNQIPNYTLGVQNPITNIGLSPGQINREHNIVDIWNGYISFEFTKFQTNGEPYQPKIGQTVRDKSTGATAEVAFIERNGTNVKIFVKNTTGTWSKGFDYGDLAAIEFLAIPSDPSSIYQIDREIGNVNAVSLGNSAQGIGDLLVFENTVSIELDNSLEIQYTGQNELIDAEYWLYTNRQILGAPITNESPSIINSNWKEIFNIPADINGEASNFTNEGMYSIYKSLGQGHELIGNFTTPDRQSNRHLGSQVTLRIDGSNQKAFVAAKGDESIVLPGKIYFVNNGTIDGVDYSWDLAKFKKYKGAFDETLNYRTGDIIYLDDPDGTLYEAKTNLVPSVFNIANWTEKSEYIDYVGHIPNNTGTVVINDSVDYSTILDQELLETFGSTFDVSKNGDVLVARATYLDKPSKIVVYRNINGLYQLSQTIITGDDSTNQLDSTTSGLGTRVAISGSGLYIAINEPLKDTIRKNEGRVLIYKQINGSFELLSVLENQNYDKNEQFGTEIDFDGEKLLISAKNSESIIDTTYDNNNTTFDYSFTRFAYTNANQGKVYIYDNIDDEFLLAQILSAPDNDIENFGSQIVLKNNNIYATSTFRDDSIGQIYNFKLTDTTTNTMWLKIRSLEETVDLSKIKKVFLYNRKTDKVIRNLDYIDIIQGKIAGVAEQEISFKTPDDPASYNIVSTSSSSDEGEDVIFDSGSPWAEEYVGKVWWDISNASFLNTYQNDVIYNSQTQNTLIDNSSIDVYEWVESRLTPSEYDSVVQEGLISGGFSVYGNRAYTVKQKYDVVSEQFVPRYYFWVKNKSTIPNVEGRNISISQIASIISNPVNAGIEFVSFLNGNSFLLNNVKKYLTDDDIVLSVQTFKVGNEDNNSHLQYQITTENLGSSQPNDDIILKWYDSLIGYDDFQRPVPDPRVPIKYRYGNLFIPRQTWFENRIEALKQVVERTNYVLKQNLIVDNKDLTPLFDADPPPTSEQQAYDQIVDTYDDLTDIKTEKFTQAKISLVIENGRVSRVDIVSKGRGYKVAPTVEIIGQGSGAVISTTIDSVGKLSSVVIENAGQNYDKDTIATVRSYRVLVNSDSNINTKWAIYERDTVFQVWTRAITQKFDTTLYWNYIDWYAKGYNQNTEINHIVETTHDIYTANINFNQTVKIKNVGTGGWLLLRRVNTTNSLDYTIDYDTIGRQNGTIEFSERLYKPLPFGYDSNSFDIKLYDFLPIFELRIILYAIKNNLFVNDLLDEYNKLFFASIRYLLSEQNNADWLFKTSFIKAKHNVGKLRKDLTFNNDNLPSYENYIEEIKPYKTKIREYLSIYDRLEPARALTTDFDLRVVYDDELNRIVVPKTKFINDQIEVESRFVEDYPNKIWLDNASFEITAVNIIDPGSGYRTPPIINLTSESGTGAEIKTYIGTNGKLKRCEIINPGKGYFSVPEVEIISNITDSGTPAKISVEIGNSKTRSLTSKMKFDRITNNFVVSVLESTESFVASGTSTQYTLKWPLDIRTDKIKVYVNDIELLLGDYTYENIEDKTKSYLRYLGRITTNNPLSEGSEVRIEYSKSIELLNAADRIGKLYLPQTEGLGKELSQLMSGVDYGGVEVKGLEFDNIKGWDNDVWFNSTWDSYVDTNEDEIFTFDGSTTQITLSSPLEANTTYNVYLNNTRLDDSAYDGSTIVDNPNAIMESLIGDGVTQTLYLDEFRMPGSANYAEIKVVQGDVLVIRKTSSDGTFAPMPDSIDTNLSGGNLTYGNAQGLLANDITIDGDNFVTPNTSGSVEEHVPGQVLDTLNIKVTQKAQGGSSVISSDTYYGDGSTKIYKVNADVFLNNQIIARLNGDIVDTAEFTVDFNNSSIEFNTAPANGDIISISNFSVGGNDILASESLISDGSTLSIITSVPYKENLQSIVSVDGIEKEHQLVNDDAGNTVVEFADSIQENAEIQYNIYNTSDHINYSQLSIENLTADGSSTQYEVQEGQTRSLNEWQVVVTVNDQVLDPGYYETFNLTANVFEYSLNKEQVDLGNIPGYTVEVYIDDTKLQYLQDYNWDSDRAAVILDNNVVSFDAGQDLKVYVRHNAEYQFGNFVNEEFIVDNNTITFDTIYAENAKIKIYRFNNATHQGLIRDRITVKSLSGLQENTKEWRKISNIINKKINLTTETVDAQYVWLSRNKQLLTPNVDYVIDSSKKVIEIITDVDLGDEFLVIHFAAGPVQSELSWIQFKDILNRTRFYAITNNQEYTLADDLYWYDKKLTLKNADNLPSPGVNDKPGIIWINGERIEYYVRDGNVISQIRRGTLGTGVPVLHEKSTEVLYINDEHRIPYKDETFSTIFTADGTSSEYELDFTPTSESEFEVFVAGSRLRKNSIASYRFEYKDDQGNVIQPIDQDSPEGDITLEPDFTIVDDSKLVLKNTPPENVKILVIRKKGMSWYESGKSLKDSATPAAVFLQNVSN